jgi:dipeptidyl aminopeptidase/acylaminoacyl peptidase
MCEKAFDLATLKLLFQEAFVLSSHGKGKRTTTPRGTKARFDFRRYLNIRSANCPSFSPDGKYVAFLMNTTGVPQVWRIALDGGWPEQLTFYNEEISFCYYAPVGDRLIFGMDQGGNERVQFYMLQDQGSHIEALTDKPKVIHMFGDWSADGRQITFSSNERHEAFFDAYLMNVDSKETRRILQHDGTNHAVCFTPDGKKSLVRRANTNLDRDLYLVDLKSAPVNHLTPHQGEAYYSSEKFSPDSRELYLVSDENREFASLAVIDLASRKTKALAQPNWGIDLIALSNDGKRIGFVTNVEGYSLLRILDLAKGRSRLVKGIPRGVIDALTWSYDDRFLAFTFNGPPFNSDIWLYSLDKGRVRQLTFSGHAGIPRSSFVEPKLVHYKTFDERNIPAFLYVPKDAQTGRKGPVVVYVHGGPESQVRPSFNQVIQYLVNNEYAVFAPNVRGSTGYGKAYVHLDDVRKRMDSVHDLKYAAEWLAKSGLVEKRKIAVMGGSYGGFMVLSAVTQYPELWAAGVDLYGIANFPTFFKSTGPWRRKLRAAEYGDPEKDADFLREISPIHYVDRIVAPLMFVQGINDPRVPQSETDQMVAALKAKGVPVTYVLFDDEGHGIVKLKNRIVAYETIVKFLDQHLKPSAGI